MKRKSVFLVIALFAITAVSVFAQASGGTAINFVSIEADGYWDDEEQAGSATTKIYIELDKRAPLMLRDITITPDNACEIGVVQNGSGNGINWTIFIRNVTQRQEVTVTIQKQGYTFNPASRTVEIFTTPR